MQTEFRPHLSTQDNLAIKHYDLYEKPLFRKPRTLVAIDLRKASDSIPHKTVVEAAQRRGICGDRLLNFIKAFLQDRTYQIAIGNTKSQ